MRERHAMKRPADLTPGKRRIRFLSGRKRLFWLDADKGIQRRLPKLDACEERFRQLDRRKVPVTDGRSGVCQRK
jgi:hypothetical protein